MSVIKAYYLAFFGKMMVDGEQVRTFCMERERLTTSINTPASSVVQTVITRLGMPSGPAALWMLTCVNKIDQGRASNPTGRKNTKAGIKQ